MIVSSAAGKIPSELQKKIAAVVIYGAGNGSGIKGALANITMVSFSIADGVSRLTCRRQIAHPVIL
jgi:hypothetical protein